MTITFEDLQPKFKFEVAAMPGGEGARRCFECGVCTGVCPVSLAEPGYDPRKILHMIKLGLKDRLLSSEVLWYCTHCETCTFVCPQGVKFNTVIDVLREMAIKEGYADPSRYEQWGTCPCKAGCPANINIQGFVGAILRGRYEQGVRLIKQQMPFASVCGRVCWHPCEANCNRGRLDEPVSIKNLKRFLSDMDIESGSPYLPKKKPATGKKAAVVGSGPAGLTAAYYLAIEGHDVVVFEKHPLPGGMMALGIPEYRLPQEVLQAEIDCIRRLGVEIRVNTPVGPQLPLEKLRDEYDAVFLAVGLPGSYRLNVPGEDCANVTSALEYLRAAKLDLDMPFGRRAVVVGGGNVAIDAARTALRKGAEKVSMCMLESADEQPASPWEIEEALEEGVTFVHRRGVGQVRSEDGCVCGLVLKKCLRVFDENGRFSPEYDEEDVREVPADLVITAIGQRTDLSFLGQGCELKVTPRGVIEADPATGATNLDGVFAGGDAASGPRTVVEAVAFGKKAAAAMDRYMRGLDFAAVDIIPWKGMEFKGKSPASIERQPVPLLPLPDRKKSFKEISLGFDKEHAVREAGRCLRLCGIQKETR